MSSRPSLRNRRDGASNSRYDVRGRSISGLYYDPARPSAFSNLQNLRLASTAGKKNKSGDVIRAWLEKQDAYTLHRPVRKRFARNPYTVNNVMNVWQCDLMDCPMQNIMIITDIFY